MSHSVKIKTQLGIDRRESVVSTKNEKLAYATPIPPDLSYTPFSLTAARSLAAAHVLLVHPRLRSSM